MVFSKLGQTDLIMDFSGLYSAQWTFFFSLTPLLSACFAIDCMGWLWICLFSNLFELALLDQELISTYRDLRWRIGSVLKTVNFYSRDSKFCISCS